MFGERVFTRLERNEGRVCSGILEWARQEASRDREVVLAAKCEDGSSKWSRMPNKKERSDSREV